MKFIISAYQEGVSCAKGGWDIFLKLVKNIDICNKNMIF